MTHVVMVVVVEAAVKIDFLMEYLPVFLCSLGLGLFVLNLVLLEVNLSLLIFSGLLFGFFIGDVCQLIKDKMKEIS